MTNPFEKRVTEYLRDEAAFLSVVTPDPLFTFFEKPAEEERLYDRLSIIIGTPGSGKTTIASLLQYKTVSTLLENPNLSEYKTLITALKSCKIIESQRDSLRIRIMSCRIPLESEYRNFWELPYDSELKIGLLKSFLQARAMLSWLRSLKSTSINLSSVKLKIREGAEVIIESIGGIDGPSIFEKAKEIERSIYEIATALVPPSASEFDDTVSASYHPFDAIEKFIINDSINQTEVTPLVILDDAHTLHPDQLSAVVNWLTRREMKIGRWLLMRLDAQTPQSIIVDEMGGEKIIESESQIKKSREITHISLQNRSSNKKQFRLMAKNMADKYLRLMPVFSRKGLTSFSDLLNTKVPVLSGSKLKDLKSKVDNFASKINLNEKVRSKFEKDIDIYFLNSATTDTTEDVRLAVLHIMLHRYVNRVPQKSLFNEDDQVDLNFKPIKVHSGLVEGARIFLMHKYNRPYYFGIDALCDGSSENAEQFLQLSSELVKAAETRIIRSKQAILPPSFQHKLLVARAEDMIREWAFPKHIEVKKICQYIAKECLEKSLKPNASLNGGPNAFGVLQEEFENIAKKHPELANILKFAVAYNAISIKSNHSTKNKKWTLIELTGPALISRGLTLSRGGFLERSLDDLLRALNND